MMTTNAAKSADINIYGPILDSSWWNDNVTTPKQIQDKLSAMGNISQINVHINSPGGSVFAGQAIHNMLRQHAANVTIYIDGLAASIASVIAMAGNKIVMPPGAMMMIHNPLLSLWGSYEAAEMREMANVLDKIKESLVATYLSRKTNKSKDEIVAIMDKTTWLTAADAVKDGFADEIEGEKQISASMTGSVLNIAGLAFDLACFDTLPSFVNSLPAVQPLPDAQNIKSKEEQKLPDIKNIEELRKEYPDLVNQLIGESVSSALQKEKDRTTALDALNDGKHPAIAEIIQDAKNSGKTAEDIKAVIEILKKHPSAATPAAQNKGQEFLIAAIAGNKASGVDNIQADVPGSAADEQEFTAAVNFMTEGLNRKAGKEGAK